MKSVFKKLNLLIFLLIINIVQLNAQILDDPGGDPGFEDVPVDGGLTVLLVAGVGLACRKLKSRDTSRRVFQKL
jgi:hypothetical protein